METKKKITIKEIREQVIEPALSNTSYKYRVFASTGAYQRAIVAKNYRQGIINALIETTDSDIALLGGGINAVAMNIRIMFLIPVDDTTTSEGDFAIVDNFREELSQAFSMASRVDLTLGEGDNKQHFVGAVSVGLPIGRQLLQRPGIGKSFEYTCYLEIAFLENAINSADITFYLDEDYDNEKAIPCTTFSFNRKNTLTANLYSNDASQASKTFAENSTFGVDLAMPAIQSGASAIGKAVNEYLMGDAPANTPHTLYIKTSSAVKEEKVIFGEVVTNGGGTENVSWQVSFVPYIEAEDEDE
jgi:hypothetical protein